MRRSDLRLSVITDEVSPSLDEGLALARAEGVDAVDLRMVDGRNVLALTRQEAADAARRVRVAGLGVACLCTPLLKWSPPGRAAAAKGDQFGFDLGERSPGEVYAQAFATAEVLGARDLRIFSYLAYDGFRVQDLGEDLGLLLELAERHDMKLHVENESVCNIAGFEGLEALVTAFPHPRLKALPDIANAWRRSRPPTPHDLARLLPHTDILHFKDYDNSARRFVPVGQGDVPFADLLSATLPGHAAPLTLTIETHAPAEPAATTRASIRGLRRMVDGLGLA